MVQIVALAAVSLTFMACTTVGSLHSAVESGALANDDRPLGTWVSVGDDDDTVRVRVTRVSETQYHLAITDEYGKEYSREGRLAPLGDRWLLEMSAEGQGKDAIEANGGMLTYGHAVIEFGDAMLSTALFDGNELVKAVLQDVSPRLEYLVRTTETGEHTSTEILLTSPSAALRAGLEHYSRNPVVMGDWVVWRRQ